MPRGPVVVLEGGAHPYERGTPAALIGKLSLSQGCRVYPRLCVATRGTSGHLAHGRLLAYLHVEFLRSFRFFEL